MHALGPQGEIQVGDGRGRTQGPAEALLDAREAVAQRVRVQVQRLGAGRDVELVVEVAAQRSEQIGLVLAQDLERRRSRAVIGRWYEGDDEIAVRQLLIGRQPRRPGLVGDLQRRRASAGDRRGEDVALAKARDRAHAPGHLAGVGQVAEASRSPPPV